MENAHAIHDKMYDMIPLQPRETMRYRESHHSLIVTLDKPCAVCGVRNSTLQDPAKNPFGAHQIETHHYPIEWNLEEACDPLKVHQQYPQVVDRKTLKEFIDSPANLMVLCDVHHRSLQYGIHHLLAQDFVALPFLQDQYLLDDVQHQSTTLAYEEDVLSCTPQD